MKANLFPRRTRDVMIHTVKLTREGDRKWGDRDESSSDMYKRKMREQCRDTSNRLGVVVELSSSDGIILFMCEPELERA